MASSSNDSDLPFDPIDIAQLKTKLEIRSTEIKRTFEKAKTFRAELVKHIRTQQQPPLEPDCLRLLESKIADELLNFSKSFTAKPLPKEEVPRNDDLFDFSQEVKGKDDQSVTLKSWASLPTLDGNRRELENRHKHSFSTNPIDSIRNLEAKGCLKDAEKVCFELIKSYIKMIELLKREKDRLRDIRSKLDVLVDDTKAKVMYPKSLVYQNGLEYQLDEILLGLRKPETKEKSSNVEILKKKLDLHPVTVKKKKVHYWKHRVYPGFGLDIQLEELRVIDKFSETLKL